jgi:hypothetical protein
VQPDILLAAGEMSNGRPPVRPDDETGPGEAPYKSTPARGDVFDYETPRFTGAGRGGRTSGDPEGSES